MSTTINQAQLEAAITESNLRSDTKLKSVAVGYIYPIPQQGYTPANEPAPTKNGIYTVTVLNATYTNFGGIVVPNTTGIEYKIQVSDIEGTPVYTLLQNDVAANFSDTPTVDYIAFAPYTTANKLLIDVSDTAKVYVVFDETLKRLEIYKDGDWGAVSDEEALALKANQTEVDEVKTKTNNLTVSTDGEFTLTDLLGYIAMRYDNTNGFDVAKISDHFISLLNIPEVQDALTQIQKDSLNSLFVSEDGSFKLMDLLGYIGLKYDNTNGFDVAKISDSFKSKLQLESNNSVQLKISEFEGDFMMHIIYGQSLATGGAQPINEEFYTAKMFTNGVSVVHNYLDVANANDESIQSTRFGGAIVDMSKTGGFNNGRYVTKIINELIVSENGKDLNALNHNLFGMVGGASGGQWYQLTKWNEPRTQQWVNVQPNVMPTALAFGANAEGRNYLNLVQAIYFANKYAKEQGKKLRVGSLSYVQGEASSDKENTVTTFKAKLNALFDDISADVTTITGQTKPVQFITYQNASFALYNEPTRPEWGGSTIYTEGVPLAHLQVALERTDTHLGTPLYPFSPTIATTGDLIHLKNEGYACMSSMFGIKAKRVVNDNEDIKTLYPIENEIETWGSGVVWFTRIPFNVSVKPLVFDVDGVSGVNMRGHGLQPNYGFEILNNSDIDVITEVKLSGEDAIVIETTENPSTLDLTYAKTGAMGGGNLRDSQGDIIKTTFLAIEYPMHNWCPFFRITL